MAINTNFHAKTDKYTYNFIIEKHRQSGLITNEDTKLILQYIEEKKGKGLIDMPRAQRIATMLTQWRRFIECSYMAISTLDKDQEKQLAKEIKSKKMDAVQAQKAREKAQSEHAIYTITKSIDSMKTGKSAYNRPYTQNTLNQHIKALKTFLNWLKRKEIIIIDQYELNEIKPPKEVFVSISPKDILTDEQINALIDAAPNVRDKAWIALLAESGVRPEEAANLVWKDLDIDKDRVCIRVTDAKDPSKYRSAYVVIRMSFIRELRKLQADDNEDEFIFRMYDPGRAHLTDIPVSEEAMRKSLVRIAKKAEITFPKGAKNRLFRTSNVTNKLKAGLNTAAIAKTTWGVGMNSRMFRHYEKLADTDTERMILAVNGIEKTNPIKTVASKPIRCVCGILCAPGAKFCPECGTPLVKKPGRNFQDIGTPAVEFDADTMTGQITMRLEDLNDIVEKAVAEALAKQLRLPPSANSSSD